MSKGVYDLLTDLAVRCDVKSEKIIKKSKELITLLNSKQQLNCSDTCKVVVCLELASSLSSTPLNREEAIKYSGCKKRIYTNFYNNISKLLNLDRIYSVGEICLLVGVSDVREPASDLLTKYKSSCKNVFEHPMYACAAILAFCKTKKIKLNLSKLVEISRVKKFELEDLTKEFITLIEPKKINKKTEEEKLSVEIINKRPGLKDVEETPEKRKSTSVMSDKEYEEWKRKMLEE